MGEKVHKASEEIRGKIDKACKEVVMQDEVTKMRDNYQKQLVTARQNLTTVKQQTVFWESKINQLAGGIATCNDIIQKSQKVKRLELESGNNKEPQK